MTRAKKILMVYAELRRALGDSAAAGEVLATAEQLVDLADYREVIDRCGSVDWSAPGCIAVDRAFDDGGWRLLHEQYSSGLLGDEDEDALPVWCRSGAAQLMEHWA